MYAPKYVRFDYDGKITIRKKAGRIWMFLEYFQF